MPVVEYPGGIRQDDIGSGRARFRHHLGRRRAKGQRPPVRAELLCAGLDGVAEGVEPVERGSERLGVGGVEEDEDGVTLGRGGGRQRLRRRLGAGGEGEEEEDGEGAQRLGSWRGCGGKPPTLGFVAER